MHMSKQQFSFNSAQWAELKFTPLAIKPSCSRLRVPTQGAEPLLQARNLVSFLRNDFSRTILVQDFKISKFLPNFRMSSCSWIQKDLKNWKDSAENFNFENFKNLPYFNSRYLKCKFHVYSLFGLFCLHWWLFVSLKCSNEQFGLKHSCDKLSNKPIICSLYSRG